MSDSLSLIKRAAEAGLKYASTNQFPIDRMESCLRVIIDIVEATNVNQTNRPQSDERV